MKALVLARGRGRRMREGDAVGPDLTDAQRQAAGAGWKALMPIGPHTFLDFVLSALADAGCEDAALVIGPEQRSAFADYEGRQRTTRMRVSLLEQREPLGTADALRTAGGWAGDDPFLTVNGDNLYPVDALCGLSALDGPGLAVFNRDELDRAGNIPASRATDFAIVRLATDGALEQIIEKPAPGGAAAGEVLISMNAWRFDGRIFDACRDVPMSTRGEYELPAAVELAVSRGVRFAAVRARGAVLDLSRQTDIAQVTRLLAGVRPNP